MSLHSMGLEFPGELKLLGKSRYSSQINLRYLDLMNFYKEFPRARGSHFKANMHKFNECVYDKSDSGFAGGNVEDLYKPHHDMNGYNKAKEQLESHKVWKRVSQVFDDVTAKKRVKCQYDGEYDFDKRWEIEPFNRRAKTKVKTRIIRMHVECGFSAYVGAETINNYGAFITAIVNLLEKSGVLVELYAGYSIEQLIPADKNGSFNHIEVKVKDADEYLPLQKILKIFSSVFFRRLIFGAMVVQADVVGAEVSSNLGKPKQWGKVWEVTGDKVCIYSVPSMGDQEKIIEKLVGFLNEV